MKRIILIICLAIFVTNVYSQDAQEKKLADAVETLRKAMLDGDSLALMRLTDPALTYGHSKGKIENQQAFVSALASGRSDFKSIELSDQQIILKGKTAIVRHILNGDAVDNGKEDKVKLGVMMVWIKDNKEWKLLARQAIRL